eukprot:TRINITY_DN25022_c1_g4_i1.p1 TRINITY_DN25022_c1_g4~~TRINITY_DN25022_c1_g4_i1.p1  ORF type:complete len:943 (-),score=182.10 TRINITY_DN25022_c1_g4_i1:72-2546(-)
MKDTAEEVTPISFKLVQGYIKLDVERKLEESKLILFSSMDLVLFTQGSDPTQEHPVHFLALVDNSFHNKLSVTVKLPQDQGEGSRAVAVAQAIKKRAHWNVAKVTGLATMIREYEGLVSLPHIHLKSTIVNREEELGNRTSDLQNAMPRGDENDLVPLGGNSANGDGSNFFENPPLLRKWLLERYNESQLSAMTDSRKVGGITLVQGPPGTGKTTTICGILAGLLSAKGKAKRAVSYTRNANAVGSGSESEDDEDEDESDAALQKRQQERLQLMRGRAKWFQGGYVPWADTLKRELAQPGDASLRQPFKKLGQDDLRVMSEVQEDVAPKKVLVCAPSNAGIDEVLRRILRDGICDGDGHCKMPSVVRLGPNVHASLADYALDNIVDKNLMSFAGQADLNQRELQKERVLRDARIICVTLSVAGSRDLVGVPFDFDTVVVDEASQGVEVAMLVPLKLGCKRLILVGDPEQLPATCFSAVAIEHKYERSLFQRLRECQYRVNMLQTQYRMHPAISAFPSMRFYGGLLKDMRGTEAFEKTFVAPWSKIPCFGPVCFFNLRGEHTKQRQSLVNEAEADFVIQLFALLSECYPGEEWTRKIAVISPYAEQVQLIRSRFRTYLGIDGKRRCPVEVNTVDGFQGREKDCVIVSTVRASSEKCSIGFVRDKRRMNVALTRGKTNCWVVGRSETLRLNEDWGAFIDLQAEACRFLNVSSPHETFLSRYLDDWHNRHPDVPRPNSVQLQTAAQAREAGASAEAAEATAVMAAGSGDESLGGDDDAGFDDKLRDIEEVSDDEADFEKLFEKADDAGGDFVSESAPKAKRNKTEED